MKKTLSVLLAVCMIFTLVPFFAFAGETLVIDQNYLADANVNYSLASGRDYRVENGTTITVPANTTLFVGSNAELFISEGATLDIVGNVVIQEGGKLTVDGNVTNADKITNNGIAQARLVFPALTDFGLDGKVEISYASSYSGSAYDDIDGNSLSYTKVECDYDPVDAYVPLNQYLYVIAHIIEPVEDRDKFDDALLIVRLNNVEIPYTQGNHHTLLTTGGKLSYSFWKNDDFYLKTYRIDLPVKEGVEVYGREGESGSTDTIVYIKYGKPFSFRVDLDDAYSKSPIEVYIVAGYGWTNMDTSTILADLEPVKPDANGYYNIPSVQSDYTVFVMGVIPNETVEKVGGIFEQVKSIFEMLKKFFNQFLALFGLSLG